MQLFDIMVIVLIVYYEDEDDDDIFGAGFGWYIGISCSLF
jgi:hypothetical protein